MLGLPSWIVPLITLSRWSITFISKSPEEKFSLFLLHYPPLIITARRVLVPRIWCSISFKAYKTALLPSATFRRTSSGLVLMPGGRRYVALMLLHPFCNVCKAALPKSWSIPPLSAVSIELRHVVCMVASGQDFRR